MKKKKVMGVFCLNSKCVNHFENTCLKIWEANTLNIAEDGKCDDFKPGKHIGYNAEEKKNPFEFTTEEVAETVRKTSKLMGCDYETTWEKHTHAFIKMSVSWEDVKKILRENNCSCYEQKEREEEE